MKNGSKLIDFININIININIIKIKLRRHDSLLARRSSTGRDQYNTTGNNFVTIIITTINI